MQRSFRSCLYRFVLIGIVSNSSVLNAADIPDSFTLAKYLPSDVWMYVHGLGTEKSEYIDAQWYRVFRAAWDSGIIDEFRDMIADDVPDHEARKAFQTHWNQVIQMVSEIDCAAMMAGEVVYAQQAAVLIPHDILMVRADEEVVARNAPRLAAILKYLADLSDSIRVVEEVRGDVQVTSLVFDGSPFAFVMLKWRNVISFHTQKEGADRMVRAFLKGVDVEPLTAYPKLREALNHTANPNFMVMYFDFQKYREYLENTIRLALGGAYGGEPSESARQSVDMMQKVLDRFDIVDYVVSAGGIEGLQQIQHSYVRMQDGADGKGLMRSVTNQKPFEHFEKYVPATATNFGLMTLMNPKTVYAEVIDMIRHDVPNGEPILERWAGIQHEYGIDVEKDIVGWMSGEIVTAQWPRTIGGQDHWIFMMRASDAVAAKENVGRFLNYVQEQLKSNPMMPVAFPPVEQAGIEGFRRVVHPMLAMAFQPIVGVHDEWLVLASSERAFLQHQEVMAGKRANILTNEQFIRDGISTEDSVWFTSFQDLRNIGPQMGAMASTLGFAAPFVPNKPDLKPIKRMLVMFSKLSGPLSKIDFLVSASSVTTFDGRGFNTKSVTTYLDKRPADKSNPQESRPARTK